MLTLGIDIGTSGVRTAVLEGDTVLSDAKADHPPSTGNIIDANAWWHAVRTCLHSQMDALNALQVNPARIGAIAVDGTSGSMVLTDANLIPVSPALMYNSKGFHAEAARIAKLTNETHITSGSNSALARAMRLMTMTTSKPCHLLHQADFIAAKLMGFGGHSDFNNALKLGFDPETGHWPSWISTVIDPDLLPKIHMPGKAISTIYKKSAETFGLSKATIIHAGTTDSIAAFLASAPCIEGNAVTSLGSTLAVKLLSKKRIDAPEIGLYSHRLGDLWLVGGASNTGGAVLKSFFTPTQLHTLSTLIDPDTISPLNYYPLLQPGERFPINDPELAPILEPRPESDVEFLHGLLESIARIEAQCYTEIATRGGPAPREIYTAGGGSHNAVWSQIRSRHLKVSLSEAAQSEAAVGAAKLARTYI